MSRTTAVIWNAYDWPDYIVSTPISSRRADGFSVVLNDFSELSLKNYYAIQKNEYVTLVMVDKKPRRELSSHVGPAIKNMSLVSNLSRHKQLFVPVGTAALCGSSTSSLNHFVSNHT